MIKKINFLLISLIILLTLNFGRMIKEKGLDLWTLEQNESSMGLKKTTDTKELLVGDSVIISFKAKYNNLSQVVFWFDTNNRINKDKLIFRIKDVSENNWYFQNQIDTDGFVQNTPYYINFPVIGKSEGHVYQLELESLSGSPGNAIYLSGIRPFPAIRFQYNTAYFKQNKLTVFSYSIQKIFYYAKDFVIVYSFYSIFIVIIFLLLLHLFNNLYLTSFLLGLVTCYSLVFLNPNDSSILILTQIILWTMGSIFLGITSKVSAFVSVVLLLSALVLNLVGLQNLGESFATWSVMFILSSAIIQNYQFHHNPNINFRQFWSMTISNLRLIVHFIYEGTFLIIRHNKNIHNVYAVILEDRLYARQKKEFLGKISNKSYKLIGWIIIYTPLILATILSCLLVWSTFLNIKQIQNSSNLYLSYFPENQLRLFIDNTGLYFFVWYILAIASSVLILKLSQRKPLKKTTLRYKLLIIFLALYVIRLGTNTIADVTTKDFRDNVVIWTVGPNETAEPWVDVTITGRNFGEMPFIGKVYIDGVEQRVMGWKKNEIIFRTNPLTTRSGRLVIRNYNKAISNTVKFVYTGNR